MTQYTIGKDGKIKSKGGGKKPLDKRYVAGDIPLTVPWGIKKIKSKRKENLKKKGSGLKTSKTKTKKKQPKKVWA